MSTGINCLLSNNNNYTNTDKSNCGSNSFGENRPKCEKINDREDCNGSVGCYYSGSQCKYIDSDYCETA